MHGPEPSVRDTACVPPRRLTAQTATECFLGDLAHGRCLSVSSTIPHGYGPARWQPTSTRPPPANLCTCRWCERPTIMARYGMMSLWVDALDLSNQDTLSTKLVAMI